MAFKIQNDNGDVENANAYISVEFFKSYHDLRGNDYSDFTDSQIEIAIVKATDFIDVRFIYVGNKNYSDQTTEFPRNGYAIPNELKQATAEYSFRALSAVLLADPEHNAIGKVKMRDESLGPLKDVVEYFENRGDYEMPNYPMADRKLIASGYVMGQSMGFLTR